MIFLDKTQSRAMRTRKVSVLAGIAFTMALSASSGAMAQNCGVSNVAGTPAGGIVGPGASLLGQIASSTASQVSASASNSSTTFQAGQGSAFVSAPSNPPAYSDGGGIWVRGTGGQNTTSSTSTTQTLNQAPGAGLNQTATVTCNNLLRDNYTGFQIGADTAKLNWNGWNFHLGTIAGYVESDSKSLNDAFSTKFQIPSVGTYVVATYGRFFADALLKQDYFNISLNNPGLGFFNQPISGTGTSFAVNAGYNFALANNWFIEPSAGFVYSKTRFDSFSSIGQPGVLGAQGVLISGTQALNDITSEIGRASLRIGTSFQSGNLSLQPFFTASVYREFAGNVTSSFSTVANGNFFSPAPGMPGSPATFNATTSTTRIGTYGQYSLGIAGQIINTGWLGFARVDYRNGDNIEGWAGTAGLRYQFTPEMMATRMPTKAPARAMMYNDVNWSGFYIGAHGGAGYDRDRIGFVGSTESANTHFAGILGGGQIGYNYQLANKFVLGLEGDVSWGDLKGGQTCGSATGLSAPPNGGNPTGAFDPFFQTCNTRMDWLATATGKLGYSWDRTLYYLKGGVAFTDENVTVNCIVGPANGQGRQCNSPAGPIFNTLSTSASRTGWTLGFGAEFALNANWSAKAEYDYISFGSRTGTASDGTLITSRTDVQMTKVGVNYRFNAGGPVVARY